MGGPCTLHLWGDSHENVAVAADSAIREVQRLEKRYSRHREDSVLSEINRFASAGAKVLLDEETAGLMDYAFACYRKSDGLFDITSGLLGRVWRFPGI